MKGIKLNEVWVKWSGDLIHSVRTSCRNNRAIKKMLDKTKRK